MAQKPDLAKHELWRQRLQEFERGNETIVEFCRRCGVAVWSFYYWRNKLQPATIPATAPDGQRNGTATPTGQARLVHRARRVGTRPRLNFIPIQVTGSSSVEVQFSDGTRIMVPCADHGAIGVVIAALVRDLPERRTC